MEPMTEFEAIEYEGAVFADRVAAEGAVDELRRRGLADDHLGVAIREPLDQVFEADVEHDERVAIEEGVIAGAPLGALAGMALIGVALPGIGTVAVGGLLAAGAAAGGVFGAFIGGLLGMASKEAEFHARETWEGQPLQPGEVLVVVGAHHEPDLVRSVLASHGGRVLDQPT